MKYLIVLAGIVALFVGVAIGSQFVQNKTEYVRTEETVEVDALETAILNALTASSTDIETHAQKAYDDARAQMEVEIELSVREAYRKGLEAKEEELMGKASF